METIEAAAIGNELGPLLLLEDLPESLLRAFGMGMRLGVGDALVHEPGVQLVEGLEPQSRGEETLADEPDLVLHLALLPARGRRASDGIDEIVRAHLLETAIVLPVLADENRLHRRFPEAIAQQSPQYRRRHAHRPLKNAKAHSCAPNTISCVPRG
jgi:hypothetical protein